MTHDEYWYGDVWMIRAFREKDKLDKQRENQKLWIAGMYIYEAICDASPLFHAFAKKGTKAHPYRDRPYPLNGEKDIKSEAEKQQEIKNEQLKSQWFFKSWAKATAKHFNDPESGKLVEGGE